MPTPQPTFIYLASQSPRRQELLQQIGVRFELLLPEPHEDAEALEAVLPGESPERYVQRVAELKLQAALRRRKALKLPPAPVLCADTTVAQGRRILGKPEDATQAMAMLSGLSGREHLVHTAVAVAKASGRQHFAALCSTRVRLAEVPTPWLAAYVARGEAFGRAGAYGIQGSISSWIESIRGSYSGVMGLPLFETAQLLRRCGLKV